MKTRIFFIFFFWVHGLAWAENASSSKKLDPSKTPNTYGEEDAWILDVYPPSENADTPPPPVVAPSVSHDKRLNPAPLSKKETTPQVMPVTVKTDPSAATVYVERAIFTSGVSQKEPLDILHDAPITLKKVYFFSELRNLDGKIATHRWYYNDQPVTDMQFAIAGPRWRIWSFKELAQGPGTWKVQVITDGKVIMEHQLPVTGAAAAIAE